MAEAIKYRAFLSYSHIDASVAKRVHGMLESFHIDKDLVGRATAAGPIPETLRPIFRDRNEFDVGAVLAEQTNIALDSSAALIVLASPHAARSKYVNTELRVFRSRHPERPVIPLIIDGEPGDPHKECFPPALRFAVERDGEISETPIEVLAADLREDADGIELALAKVVARVIGVPPDDIYRRADRERRKQARKSQRVRALIYMLLVGVIAVLVAWINQSYIIEQWRWWTTQRPFRVAYVWPYSLTATAERALHPKDSFKECATERGNDYCPEMVIVAAGSFTMGSPSTEPGRYPNEDRQHRVAIARAFAISKYEVAFDEWDTCVDYGDCRKGVSDSGFGRGQRPVINVSWDDAKQYVDWLSKITSKQYHLLTEPEYEYAARAGTQSAYPWGDNVGRNNVNCNGCGSEWDNNKTAPVDSFQANGFGLYQMVGNVWSWLEDCYHPNYEGAPDTDVPWTAGECTYRVVRGGAWDYDPRDVRSAARDRYTPVGRLSSLGFRVGRTLHLSDRTDSH
jgi:formylglycine-generating enzyme required for sulfatase activity